MRLLTRREILDFATSISFLQQRLPGDSVLHLRLFFLDLPREYPVITRPTVPQDRTRVFVLIDLQTPD